MILGINYVAMSVPDLDKAIEFYYTNLDFETVMINFWEKTERDLHKKYWQ
jgi:catechol 2,3-dioxygenase-like lactoylglutathione lyase family enzyme